jgi:hypothetical protein
MINKYNRKLTLVLTICLIISSIMPLSIINAEEQRNENEPITYYSIGKCANKMKDIQTQLQTISSRYLQGRWPGTEGEHKSSVMLKNELSSIIPNGEVYRQAYLFSGSEIEDKDKMDLTLYYNGQKVTVSDYDIFPSHGTSKIDKNIDIKDAYVHLAPDWAYTATPLDDPIHYDFTPIDANHIVLIDMEECTKLLFRGLAGDYSVNFVIDKLWALTNADAFLAADSNYNTYFCDLFDNLKFLDGMYITGKLGSDIKTKLNDNIEVKADLYYETITNLKVGFNVIGRIDCAKDTDDYILIGAHYDSVWTKGAADDSGSVSAVWGLAEYFNKNIESGYFRKIMNREFKYDLVFVAFGGEELNRIGSQRYYNNGNIAATIITGALGYRAGDGYPKEDYPLLVHSKGDPDKMFPGINDVINSYEYTGYGGVETRTGLGEANLLMMFCTDVGSFIGTKCFSVDKGGDFSKVSHWYHRGGGIGHEYGDNAGILDSADVVQSAGLIAEMIKHIEICEDNEEEIDLPLILEPIDNIDLGTNDDTTNDNSNQNDNSDQPNENQDPLPPNNNEDQPLPIDPILIISISPTSATVEEGETIDFTIETIGGSGNHYYLFYGGDGGSESGNMGSSIVISYTYSESGTFEPDIEVHDLDENNYDSNYNFALITVAANNNQNNC